MMTLHLESMVGILLLNLGTPEAPTKRAVRRYLREFLSDPRVIDLPAPLRWLLVNGAVLPFRPQKTAQAYRQIWTHEGSPLLINGQALRDSLASALGNGYRVALGMRYGQPSIESAIQTLLNQGCQKLIVLPLFPQYSSAATGSALEKTLHILQKQRDIVPFHVLSSFHDHPAFIHAWRTVVEEHKPKTEPDLWLLSYHGLPARHVHSGPCESESCHPQCYRRQCAFTSQQLAQSMQWTPTQYRTAFQSRLGPTPWITPYTDHLLIEAAQQGVKSIAVICPSFVSDCLETLEEIGIRAREQWQSLGGETFTLIPSLNAHPAWVSALHRWIVSVIF